MPDTSRSKESARGKSMQYSGDLQKLIKKFISDRIESIPADIPKPAEEIRDELTTFRFEYADLDLIHRLLLTNPSIGGTLISDIFGDKGQIPDHLSLMNLINSGVDRVLMKEAQQWWREKHPKEKAASSEDWYRYLGVVPFYVIREAGVPSGVELPYKGDRIFNETLGYLQLLQPIAKENPKAKLGPLIDKYSPDLKSMQLSDMLLMYGDNPFLVSRQASEHAKRFWNGTVYDVLQGVLEDAIAVNAKELVKLQQSGKLPKQDKKKLLGDEDSKVTEEVRTEDISTREKTRDDTPTSVAPDRDKETVNLHTEDVTVPGRKVSSVTASVIRYKGHLYVRN